MNIRWLDRDKKGYLTQFVVSANEKKKNVVIYFRRGFTHFWLWIIIMTHLLDEETRPWLSHRTRCLLPYLFPIEETLVSTSTFPCLEMVSPNENMLPISDASSSSSRTRVFTSRTRSVPLSNPTDNSCAVTLGYAGSLSSQRRPPLVPMAGPLSSFTRRAEPLFARPASPPTRRSSGYFGDLEEVNSSDNDESLKHAHRLRSGKLGMCNDPYCTTCPSNYNPKASRISNPTVSASTVCLLLP